MAQAEGNRTHAWKWALIGCALVSACASPPTAQGDSTQAARVGAPRELITESEKQRTFFALQELGPIPEMSCASGRRVPITRGGLALNDDEIREVIRKRSGESVECDAPALGNGRGMACTPNTRVVSLRTEHNGQSVYWAMICTKDWDTVLSESTYAFVNVIGWNEETGVTVFFNREREAGTVDVVYGHFPGLDSRSDVASFLSKVELHDLGCTNCHNGMPFRRTNFIRQLDSGSFARNADEPAEVFLPIPRHTWGNALGYSPTVVDRAVSDPKGQFWSARHLKKDRAPACTRCHPVQGGNTEAAIGGHPFRPTRKTDNSKFFPGSGWHLALLNQPTFDALRASADLSGASFAQSFDAWMTCLENPNDSSCWEMEPSEKVTLPWLPESSDDAPPCE